MCPFCDYPLPIPELCTPHYQEYAAKCMALLNDLGLVQATMKIGTTFCERHYLESSTIHAELAHMVSRGRGDLSFLRLRYSIGVDYLRKLQQTITETPFYREFISVLAQAKGKKSGNWLAQVVGAAETRCA